MRMHPDQVDVTPEAVAALVAEQFPEWRGRTVRPVRSHGTVNALYRLGEDIVLRFPLRPDPGPEGVDELAREQDNARRIAPHVPFAVPEPLGLGAPGEGYAGPWSAYRWIPGETAGPDTVRDWERFADDLAGFVVALHGLDAGGRVWPGEGRGGPLRSQDAYVRRCLARSEHLVDTARVAEAWERCVAAPALDGADVCVHTDLMPGNLIVRDGRLVAVIDLGDDRVGDPAVDLMPAWNLLPPNGRAAYRIALGVDDATWERGRGWAISQAIGALPYYVDTNPVMAQTARVTLAAALASD
jgi:aminoglycoside phosphotransferase (APT) family kinase protein